MTDTRILHIDKDFIILYIVEDDVFQLEVFIWPVTNVGNCFNIFRRSSHLELTLTHKMMLSRQFLEDVVLVVVCHVEEVFVPRAQLLDS
jgi:hypothetical protein